MVGLCVMLGPACGSDGDDGSAPPSSSTTAAPTTVPVSTTAVPPTTSPPRTTLTTRPAPTPAADRATAQRILFTATEVPGLKTGNPSNFVPIYARCGSDPLLPGGEDPRQAVPVGFVKDETAEVRRLQTTALGAFAALAPTEAAARAAMETLRSRDFRVCLERELTAAVNAQVAGSTAIVQSAATVDLPTPALADEVVAFRITLTERVIRRDFDLTTVRKGRALASVAVSRLGSVPFPDDERVRLARLLAGRMP